MEEQNTKENLPVGFDKGILKSVKMATSTPRDPFKSSKMTTLTPRQPLMDLKQVERPDSGLCSNVPVKSIPPLGTPKHVSKSHKSMKPSSLLKDANKENLRSQLSQRGSSVQDTGTKRMDEIFEENVEEFVTQILQQCVQDMNQQVVTGDEFSSKIGDETSKMSALSCFETSEPDCLKTENQLELSSGLSQAVEKSNGNGNQSFEKYELPAQSAGTENVETCPRRSIERHELVSQFGDMSVNEDSLLGDSHYSNCSESFTECSKSEEELPPPG